MPEVKTIDRAADIVFVGGGPIGLWTGIQSRLRTGKQVVILEKHQAYQRADIRVQVERSSFQGIPEDSKLKALIKKWAGKSVPILEIEESLTKRAHELGVTILKGVDAHPKSLPALFPQAKIFIGADGARSSVRREIFQDEFRFNSNLQYIAQVQYVIKPKPNQANNTSFQKFQDLSETYKMQKFAEQMIIERTFPQSDGSSRVVLQIFIDQATYDEISDATFKSPYYFETRLTHLPAALRKTLIRWWGAQTELQEKIILPDHTHNKLTVAALNSYAAKELFKTDENGNLWALVGDAAAGFPFFRAINNGFLLGTKLAQLIADGCRNDASKEGLVAQLRCYSRYAGYRIFIERIRAYIKSCFLNLAKLWLQISNRTPFQTIKLSTAQKKEIVNRGTKIWTQLAGAPPPT